MQEIERAMDGILAGEPELSFREVLSDLLKKGVVKYEEVSRSYVHVQLYDYYARAKQRALRGKINLHI